MKMPSESPSPLADATLTASSIKPYYLAILALLVVIAAMSYGGLRQINLQQDANTALINVSGHQRAYSLNIMLLSNLLIQETDSAQRLSLQAQLADVVTQMQTEHTQLINGTLPGSFSSPLSPTMRAVYFESSPSLVQQLQDYWQHATRLSTAPDSALTDDNPDYEALLEAWPELLTNLDNAVTQYRLEISTRTVQANQQEIIFLLSLLGVALLITWYLFLTMQRNIQSDQLKLRNEIDQHREAHQLLLRNETLYRLLARNLPNTAVLLFDQDMRYLVVEGTIMDETGFTKDSMEGKTIYEVLPRETADRLVPFYQAALTGQNSDFEFTSAQGLNYQIHSVPIKADDNRIMGGMLTIHDVTEQRKAEATLRERERFIGQITDTVPDIIYIYDVREGRPIFENRSFGELLGYTAAQIEEMGNRFMRMTIDPDDLVRYGEHVRALAQIRDGESLEFEYRMKTAEGEWRWINSHNTVFLRNDDGSIAQILGVARDIDRRKQTEEVLKRSEYTIRQIATAVPDIIYIYDLNLRRNIYANRAFGEAIGYDAEAIEALGDAFMQTTMHPDDWARFPSHFETLANTPDNTIVEFEYRVKTPQGMWRWLNSRDIVFTREADGRVAQILGVARDITEWKTAQDALQESEERFRQIAETVRSAFCILSVDSRKTYYVSPAYETIWGHSLADIYADPLAFTVAIHPEDLERVLRERKEHFARGTYNIEYRIIRPDGATRWINSRAYPVVNPQGVVERVISVSDDITERKEFEKQAFAIALEREHVRVLSTFIQDTSHDLRTPLTIMTTSLYLLRKLTDPQKQTERIDQIEKQMNHLNRIIGDLHEMSKLDIVSHLQVSNLDVNWLVDDLFKHYQTLIHKKNQTLALHLTPDLPYIPVDGEQIKHALSNIIDNALLYTDTGGTITLSTTRDETSIIIAIQDTGIGIASEHMPRIFDRFYKVDAARTSGRGGPGLGLAMVKRIVEIHGGRIEVESTLGEGSVFRVYLPLVSILQN